MSHLETGPLASYNSLTDPNLASHFANRRLRKHLRKSGLITSDGRVVSETTYRMYWTHRDQQQHMHEILASAILNKTLDMERTRQAEIRKKIDEISKIELVRRMRFGSFGKKLYRVEEYDVDERMEKQSKLDPSQQEEKEIHRRENTLPLLTLRTESNSSRSRAPNRPDSRKDSKASNDKRRTQSAGTSRETSIRSQSHDSDDVSYSVSRDSSFEARDRDKRPKTSSTRRSARRTESREAYSPYGEVPPEVQAFVPAPPKSQRTSAPSARRNNRRIQSAKQSQTPHRDETSITRVATPQSINTIIKMHYFGPSLKLDTSVDFNSRGDLVTVEQQPSGSGTLVVFRDYVKRGGEFSFESRRYRNYPFSLTLYVNSQQDCRLSTCCEYKHKSGARLGGATGRFGMVSVSGSGPCYMCQFNESETKQNKKADKKNKSDSNAIDKSESGKKKKKMQGKPRNGKSDTSENTDSRNGMKKKHDTKDTLKISVDEDGNNEERTYENDFEETDDVKHSISSKSDTSGSTTPRGSDTARSSSSDTARSASSADEKSKTFTVARRGSDSDSSNHSDRDSKNASPNHSDRDSKNASPNRSDRDSKTASPNHGDQDNQKNSPPLIHVNGEKHLQSEDEQDAGAVGKSNGDTSTAASDDSSIESSGGSSNSESRKRRRTRRKLERRGARRDEQLQQQKHSEESKDLETKVEAENDVRTDNDSADLFEGWDKSDEGENHEARDEGNAVEHRKDVDAIGDGIDGRDEDKLVVERDDENGDSRSSEGEATKREVDRYVEMFNKSLNIVESSSGDQNESVDDSTRVETDDNADKRSLSAKLDSENEDSRDLRTETFRIFENPSKDDGSGAESGAEQSIRQNDRDEVEKPSEDGKTKKSTSIPAEGDDTVSVSGGSCSDSDGNLSSRSSGSSSSSMSGSSTSGSTSSADSDDENKERKRGDARDESGLVPSLA